MFEANPETKTYFEKFKNMSNEALSKYEPFIKYVTDFMELFDTAVTELDEAEKTHQMLKKSGLDHKKRELPDTLFKEMRNPFLKAVEQILGDRYSDRMRNIYEILIEYLLKALLEGYNQ
jgi:hypothetical protein